MTTNRTFTFTEQEHTLGVLLRTRLLNDPNVIFAAYKVSHPMIRTVEVRVQSSEGTTEDAMNCAIDSVRDELDDFEIAFNNVL